MVGRIHLGQVVSFITDLAQVELFDRDFQQIIRFSTVENVIFADAKGWDDLFLEEVKLGVIDGVVVRAKLNK